MLGALLLTGMVVIALLAWWILKGPGEQATTYEVVERDAMPDEIAVGRLVYSEQTLQADRPVPLSARVDQVYLTTRGTLVPVETKRRHAAKIWPADVIELSVQATVLAHSPDSRKWHGRIADYGYVRIAAEGRKPVYLRTPLLTAAEVRALHDRYFDLHQGRVTPVPAQHQGLCRKCGQRTKCEVGRAIPGV